MLYSELVYKLLKIKVVCGRGDSNPHALASVSPSSWCVCQFRHFRIKAERKRSAFSHQLERSRYQKLSMRVNNRTTLLLNAES